MSGVLYIEVSGCLPMCGHGTIGTVTFALEQGLIEPADRGRGPPRHAGRPGASRPTSAPAGSSSGCASPTFASYLALPEVRIDCPELGELVVDIAYGGNFYAIVEPQPGYGGLDELSAGDILRLSPELRRRLNQRVEVAHPDDPTIAGVSHVMWTGPARDPKAHGRNAVFYGASAIDRSPCGTGTSARIAQLAARGKLAVGDEFVHESIIGSLFEGRIEAASPGSGRTRRSSRASPAGRA